MNKPRIIPVAAALTAAAVIAGSLSCEFTGGHHHRKPKSPEPARNIILFIADGTQLEHEIAESRYLYGQDYGLEMHYFPYQSSVATWSVNSYNVYAGDLGLPLYSEDTFDPLVGYDPAKGGSAPYPLDLTGDQAYLLRIATDSAAAATALATGVKTDNGNISWLRGDPGGGALATIAEMMRDQKGASIGVVSTVPFNHATPAVFVSHNVNRSNYTQIADEIIGTIRPEVVIGAGHPTWISGYVTALQLDTLRNSAEYELVERVAGQDGGVNLLYAAAALPAGKKLFGLFGGGGGNFPWPIPRDNPGYPGFVIESENPSLAEAARAALMVLARDPDGFFLMVEAGDIDWANHARNYAAMIGTTWQLEEAVRAAVDFVETPGDGIDWDNTLLVVTFDHANSYMRLTDSPVLGKGDLPAQSGTSYPDGEVTYASGGHTNELVTVYAAGEWARAFEEFEGAWYPGTGVLDNTQVFEAMARAAGLQY